MAVRGGARRRARTALGVTAVVLAVVCGLAALAWYLAPRVLPNIGAEVAAGDMVETLRTDTATATVTAPDGWVVRRSWGEDDEVVLRSPDGGVAVTVRVVATDAAAAFADAADAVGDAPSVTETLASGLRATHAEADGAGTVVVAVGAASGPGVTVIARAAPDRLAAYRPALAQILEGIAVGG